MQASAQRSKAPLIETLMQRPVGHAPFLHDSPDRAALAVALTSLDFAEQRGEPAILAQALTHVAYCYQQVGMSAHRRWYLQQALRFSAMLSAVDTSVDTLCELAEASVDCTDDFDDETDGPRLAHQARDQARDHVYEAARLARRSADPQWEVTVLLRISDLLDQMGDHDDAVSLQRRALGLISNGAVQPKG